MGIRYNLRKKIIRFIEERSSQKLASKIFNLNKTMINKLCLIFRKEVHINLSVNLRSKQRVDRAELIKYVEKIQTRLCERVKI